MVIGGLNAELTTLGFPNILGGFTKAPFDTIGDTLRGTRGIIMDMYRQPDKLLRALETLTPIMIGMGVGSAQQTEIRRSSFPFTRALTDSSPMSSSRNSTGPP